jgi:hypothetical protein
VTRVGKLRTTQRASGDDGPERAQAFTWASPRLRRSRSRTGDVWLSAPNATLQPRWLRCRRLGLRSLGPPNCHQEDNAARDRADAFGTSTLSGQFLRGASLAGYCRRTHSLASSVLRCGINSDWLLRAIIVDRASDVYGDRGCRLLAYDRRKTGLLRYEARFRDGVQGRLRRGRRRELSARARRRSHPANRRSPDCGGRDGPEQDVGWGDRARVAGVGTPGEHSRKQCRRGRRQTPGIPFEPSRSATIRPPGRP